MIEDGKEGITLCRLPALQAAFVRGDEARAHALLDAGVNPMAQRGRQRRRRHREASNTQTPERTSEIHLGGARR